MLIAQAEQWLTFGREMEFAMLPDVSNLSGAIILRDVENICIGDCSSLSVLSYDHVQKHVLLFLKFKFFGQHEQAILANENIANGTYYFHKCLFD